MGVLGPRRVVLTDEGELPPPPFKLTDNQYSILDETDLVFIDPMGTGYSRPVEGEKSKDGTASRRISNPLAISSACMSLAITAGSRQNSWQANPMGPRARRVFRDICRNGTACISTDLMLISAVLDFTTIDFNLNNELPYILFAQLMRRQPGITAN